MKGNRRIKEAKGSEHILPLTYIHAYTHTHEYTQAHQNSIFVNLPCQKKTLQRLKGTHPFFRLPSLLKSFSDKIDLPRCNFYVLAYATMYVCMYVWACVHFLSLPYFSLYLHLFHPLPPPPLFFLIFFPPFPLFFQPWRWCNTTPSPHPQPSHTYTIIPSLFWSLLSGP